MKKFFNYLLLLICTFSVQADDPCDLINVSNTTHSYMKIGVEDWLQVTALPAGSKGFNLGQPCEYNLNINTNDDSYDHAYFAGIHRGYQNRDHFTYSFSLKDLSNMLIDLHPQMNQINPQNEVEFFTVSKMSQSADNVMLSLKIMHGSHDNWVVKVFFNPHNNNSAYQTIHIPKFINNDCQCVNVFFDWKRIQPWGNQYKLSVRIKNQLREKVVYSLPAPNLTKLGYISADVPLSIGNHMFFGVVTNN